MPLPIDNDAGSWDEQMAEIAKIHKLQKNGIEQRLDAITVVNEVIDEMMRKRRFKTGELVTDSPAPGDNTKK